MQRSKATTYVPRDGPCGAFFVLGGTDYFGAFFVPGGQTFWRILCTRGTDTLAHPL